MPRVAQVIDEHAAVDFVDINMGCPIDSVRLANREHQAPPPRGSLARSPSPHPTPDPYPEPTMGLLRAQVCNRGMGAALAQRAGKVQSIVRSMSSVLSCPLTVSRT